jgi:hypothetical protein
VFAAILGAVGAGEARIDPARISGQHVEVGGGIEPGFHERLVYAGEAPFTEDIVRRLDEV